MEKKFCKCVNICLHVHVFCWIFSCRFNNFSRRHLQINCKSFMTVLGGVITLLNMLNVTLCLPVLCELNWNKVPGAESVDRGAERPTTASGGVGSVDRRCGQRRPEGWAG